jgi:hypothetical protein
MRGLVNGGAIELALFCFCIIADAYILIDFLRPFFKIKYLKDGFKIKFTSPVFHYFGLSFITLGAIYFLIRFITYKEIYNMVFFSMVFITVLMRLSKSYIIFCRDGLLMNGIYFSYKEKQEGQKITDPFFGRIYEISIPGQFGYVYLRKKCMDELMKSKSFIC